LTSQAGEHSPCQVNRDILDAMDGIMGALRQGYSAVVETFSGGSSNAGKPKLHFVNETESENSASSSGDSEVDDRDGQVELPASCFRFRVQRAEVKYSSTQDYSESVLKWTSKAFFGRRLFCGKNKGGDFVKVGPCTIKEITDMIQTAADNAGFSVYLHKGVPSYAPNTAKRLTLNFQCDHGRVRYGQAAQHDIEFTKDIENVVASNVRRQRATRKGYGYKRAITAHHRHKCVGCQYSLVINGTQECNGVLQYVDKEQPFVWSASQHKLSKSNDEHSNHVYRGKSTRMTTEIQDYLQNHCETSSVPAMVTHIRQHFKVSLDYSRVRYFLLKEGKGDTIGPAGGRGEGVSACANLADIQLSGEAVYLAMAAIRAEGSSFL
jgi:hypothetical protein